jgi:hypothetical protein
MNIMQTMRYSKCGLFSSPLARRNRILRAVLCHNKFATFHLSLRSFRSAESERPTPTGKLHPVDLSHQSEIITLRRPVQLVIGKSVGHFFSDIPRGIFHLPRFKAGASHLTNKKASQLFSSSPKKVIAN